MERIKIIKKKTIAEEVRAEQTVAANFDRDSRLSNTVRSWIADWRTRKEIERQSALNELIRLKKIDA